VRPEYDDAVRRDIERWFDRYASVSFANYPVPGDGWRGEER
jgi:formylmethanofuran dehydrogenase subunit A